MTNLPSPAPRVASPGRLRILPLLTVLALGAVWFARPPATRGAPKENEKGEAKGPVALRPEDAGPDFQVQGEYAGQAGPARLGAQVIALGGGTFRAVFLPGGLPGETVEGKTADGKTRIEVEGKADGGKALFAGGEGAYSAEVADNKLAGKTDTGQAFELAKVQRQSPALGAKPPEGAVVLFDGTGLDEWQGGKVDEQKRLSVGAITKRNFSDFVLHLEFIEPFKPFGRGQDRGNSGLYVQRHYEIQVLDSFGLKSQPNDCASIYTKIPPRINVSYPPLSWQTYDLEFTAARHDDKGEKTAPARVTLKHNGVVVHENADLPDHTGAGKPEDKTQRVQSGPIYLQDHGNPVFFRNVWVVEKK